MIIKNSNLKKRNLRSRTCKTPLKYPGGKSRAVKYIVNNYLKDIKSLCSPFIGGGSIEIELAQRGVRVYGYDIFSPLVCFWKSLLSEPKDLARRIRQYKAYSMTKERFNSLQEKLRKAINENNKEKMDELFFVVNKCSFMGMTLATNSIDKSAKGFSDLAIYYLELFKAENLTVEHMDFKDSIPLHKDDFLYLDPPYTNGRGYYGEAGVLHKNFDHEALCELLKSRDKWVLSYSDSPMIRKMYEGHRIDISKWRYAIGNKKISNELIILSKDFN